MQLVDDDGPQRREEPLVVDPARYEHRLERLRCREEDVRRFCEDPAALGGPDIAVPQADGAPEPGAVLRFAGSRLFSSARSGVT